MSAHRGFRVMDPVFWLAVFMTVLMVIGFAYVELIRAGVASP